MDGKYYTVEQVADLLDMHPKTIRRYIREGKLSAKKIGKSWRITGNDLSVFVEGDDKSLEDLRNSNNKTKRERINVSSVIDIDVNDMDEAMRIVNTLTAVLNNKSSEYEKSSMNAHYLKSELKVRIMLWGNIKFMKNMLDSVSVLID